MSATKTKTISPGPTLGSGPTWDLSSVSRGLAILEHLSASRDGASIAELSTALQMNKTTVFRILATLKTLGYVYQDGSTARYGLTLQLARIAYRYLAVHQIQDICMPVLRRLADETDELARLALAQGDELRWAAQAEGAHRRIRLSADLGEPVALHASATGKAWLATMSDEEALSLVLRHRMEPRTSHTITTVDALITELRKIRTDGYGLALEEGDDGVLAVAVAIPSPIGSKTYRSPGTLSIAGTILTVDRDKLVSFVPSLNRAAVELSEWAAAEYIPPTSGGGAVPQPKGSPHRQPD